MVSYFTHEEVESFPEGYHLKAVNSLVSLGGVKYDEKVGCTNCGKCVDVCPTNVLEMNPYKLDEEHCIQCLACVKACPVGALSLRFVDSEEVRERLKRLDRIFAVRREPITRL